MATCRKITAKERIAATERTTGRKLTADERVGLELLPPQYSCSGDGVGGLRGVKKSRKRQR